MDMTQIILDNVSHSWDILKNLRCVKNLKLSRNYFIMSFIWRIKYDMIKYGWIQNHSGFFTASPQDRVNLKG